MRDEGGLEGISPSVPSASTKEIGPAFHAHALWDSLPETTTPRAKSTVITRSCTEPDLPATVGERQGQQFCFDDPVSASYHNYGWLGK